MLTRKPWSYGRDIKDREYLKDDQTFESLVDELVSALSNVSQDRVRFRTEPVNGKYNGKDILLKRLKCTRAAWTIPLDEVLLDKFFNGCMGIRAQYYSSPYHGGAMNALLLSAMRKLLVKLAQLADPTADRKLFELSIDSKSAKTWIVEKNLKGKKIIRTSDLTLTEEEIQNDWLDLARALKAGEIGSDQYQIYAATINGVRAPVADQLEVKGAWITQKDRCEYVTLDKRDRDCQLFMFGFA